MLIKSQLNRHAQHAVPLNRGVPPKQGQGTRQEKNRTRKTINRENPELVQGPKSERVTPGIPAQVNKCSAVALKSQV